MGTQSNLIDLDYDKEETGTSTGTTVTNLHNQTNKMSSKEKEQLAKKLAEEEDYPSA